MDPSHFQLGLTSYSIEPVPPLLPNLAPTTSDLLSCALDLTFPLRPGLHPPQTLDSVASLEEDMPDLSGILDLEDLLSSDNPTMEILPPSTSRRKPRLLVDGFVFHERRQYKNGRILFRCSQRKSVCKASITTDEEKGRILTSSGEHNHPQQSTSDLRRLTTRSRVVSNARTTTQPFNIFAENLGVEKNAANKHLYYRNRPQKNRSSTSTSSNE